MSLLGRFAVQLTRGISQQEKSMETVVRYAKYALGIGAFCAILSLSFLYNTNQSFLDNLIPFSGNLLLNVVAEFLGLAVGGVFTALIAKELAKKKLKDLAPDLLRLIGNLRIGGTISEEAARDCVICAVHVISEDSLASVRSNEPAVVAGEKCVICSLRYETEENGARCKHCHLDGNVWGSDELKEALLKAEEAEAQRKQHGSQPQSSKQADDIRR